MSIARALTTVRRARGSSNEDSTQSTPARAGTLKTKDFRYVDRAKISLPITLLSTTNALAYDAPDLPKPGEMTASTGAGIMSPALSSASSRKSFEGSESGASSATSISTPSFSREGSPVLDAKHANGYFPTSPTKHKFLESPLPMTPLSATAFKELEIAPTAPSVPTRALSHTKQTHQTLARQRSISRMSGESHSPPSSRAPSGEIRASPIEEHPFGAELAKVMEVAEEFGVKDVQIWDEEEQFLVDQGLGRFSAEEYINDIQPLFGKAFYDGPIANVETWL